MNRSGHVMVITGGNGGGETEKMAKDVRKNTNKAARELIQGTYIGSVFERRIRWPTISMESRSNHKDEAEGLHPSRERAGMNQ